MRIYMDIIFSGGWKVLKESALWIFDAGVNWPNLKTKRIFIHYSNIAVSDTPFTALTLVGGWN